MDTPELKTWQITAGRKGWDGYVVVALGTGASVNDALRDAAGGIGASFRPKQSGQTGTQLNVTIRRPDGSQFNVPPAKVLECETAAQLEQSKAL